MMNMVCYERVVQRTRQLLIWSVMNVVCYGGGWL